MGLSLKNLGKKIYDQVNMGDNGKTWSNDNVAINARQTTQPNPYVQQAIQNARYGVLANNKAKQQQFLSSLTVKQPNTLDRLGSAAQEAGTGLGLGGVRSLTGFGQGFSGLYDLATPGTGTNRLSKGLDKFAKFTDETAKNEGVGASYKVGQFGTDALTFLAGGAVAKGISKAPIVARVTSPASKVVAPISNTLDKGIAKVAVKGTGGRIAAKGLQATKSVPNLANTATFSGYDLGQRASKGQDISGKDVAISVGSNLAMNAGLPMLGQTAKEVPGAFKNVAGDTATTTANAVNAVDQAAFAKAQIADDAIRQAVRNKEAAAVQGASKRQLDWHDKNIKQLTQDKYAGTSRGSIQLGKNVDPLESLKQEAAPMYRGASKAEWDAVQKSGKFGKQETSIGDPKGFFNDDVHTVGNKKYAENYAYTGGADGVVIEYKPTANKKMRGTSLEDTTDMGRVQEARGKGLDISDVQRVTDRNGNVIYEAGSSTYKPGSKVVNGERVSVNTKQVRDANAKKLSIEEGGDVYEIRIKENNRGDVEFQRYDSNGNFMDSTAKTKLEKAFGKLSDEQLAEKSVYGNGKLITQSQPPKSPLTVGKDVNPKMPTQAQGSLESKAADLAQAQAQKEKLNLGYSGVEGARAKGRAVSAQVFNPYSEAERFNAQIAKSLGVARKDLTARNDLAHLLDTTSNSGVYAQNLAEKSGLQDVIGRHKPGTPEEANFITYMAMKRDLNVRGIKKNVQILPYETKDMAQAVADYEKRNPGATADLKIVNDHFKTILDNARKAGTITEDAYKRALASEDYYAPVARILGSEDVLRPTINANSKGSLSHQTALQTLTGSGADRPLNTTWDAIVQATTTTTRENARNTAFNLMYGAADKKLADNMVRMGMSKEQSKALMDLRDAILTLQDDSKTAKRLVKSASRQTRADSKKATAFRNKTQDRAIKKIAAAMDKTDPDGAAALRSLNRKDQREIATWLQDGMTEAQIAKGNKVSVKASESYARLMNARAEAEGLVDQTKLASAEARGLQVIKNEKTGRQVLNGFVDGYPVWIETTPEMAKMVQGLETKDLPKAIKALSGVQHVWRTFWTGIFNPVFSIKSKLFYDPAMMAINQPGSRNQLRPGVMGNSFMDNFKSMDDFFTELKPYGVAPVTGSRMMGDVKQSAQQMASHADFQSRVGYFAKHPGEALQAMDIMGGKLQHGSRMQAARSAYERAKAANLPREDALANAARAYNNVLPNYGRTSAVLRTIDAFIPYSNAGIAGTRAMVGGFQKDKVGFTAKAGAFATALAAVGAYALTDDTTKEFYQDMYDTNKQSILQNNLVIALPGAHKDPQTGEWTGIVKVPIPPEFRAPNAVIQDANFKAKGGEANGYNPSVGAATTLATGGIANIGRDGGVNIETNPAYNSALELITNKRNSGLGDPFAYGDTQYLPRNEQINKDTSQLAISGAQAFNKLPLGDISPAALDQQFKSFGAGGKLIRSVGSGLTANENTTPDQLPGTDLKKSITSVVSADGTKGMTEATWHFKNQDQIREGLKTKDLKDKFDILNSKNDSPGDAGQKANLLYESLQTDGTLWEAQKNQNRLDVKKGGIANPLFDLTPTQARAVMLYRSNSRLNAAKQTYAKDGSSLYQSLGLDEKWYQDFRDKENAFYKKIDEKKKAKGDKQTNSNVGTAAKTYSGNVYEEASPVIKSKLDAYYKLPKGTGERSAFLKANPDIIQYWDKQTGLANEERIAMGLDLLGDGATNSYSKYGKSGGSGGSGGSNSYVGSQYKYAVSTKGSVAKSKVKAKSAGSAKIAKKLITKPKVTIKKSLV